MDFLKALAGGKDGLTTAITEMAAEKLTPMIADLRSQLLQTVTGEPSAFWVDNFIANMRAAGYAVDAEFAHAVWGRFIQSLADAPCRTA